MTPDSFSDGGKYFSVDAAVRHGLQMAEEGADFIDVGGESTKPGSDPLPLEEELRRVIPVVASLAKQVDIPLSVDTYKAAVADAALQAGASMVNDISGLSADSSMASVISRRQASLVVMHMKGTPKTMQQNPEYTDVVIEVCEFLERKARQAGVAGIQQVMVDPGIGFGKTLEHNITLIKRLREFRTLGYPLVVGPSRKSFIGTILNLSVSERLEGTAAAVAACIFNGANIVRVHDVKEMSRVARMSDALKPDHFLSAVPQFG
ncbi:MAG: folP [Bacteroidetes bacterium]|nr:folP [Bacteroidota bacterium]